MSFQPLAEGTYSGVVKNQLATWPAAASFNYAYRCAAGQAQASRPVIVSVASLRIEIRSRADENEIAGHFREPVKHRVAYTCATLSHRAPADARIFGAISRVPSVELLSGSSLRSQVRDFILLPHSQKQPCSLNMFDPLSLRVCRHAARQKQHVAQYSRSACRRQIAAARRDSEAKPAPYIIRNTS